MCFHVAKNNNYCGHIIISDELKSTSSNAIYRLKELGIKKTVMLTGDIKKVGESVQKELKIDELYSELLPDNKVQIVEKLLEEKNVLAFVGDGVNDAPVLSRSDIGIAMGALGSDAAMARGANPYELAPTFVYLSSSDSSYVTGQVMHVNGGQVMG